MSEKRKVFVSYSRADKDKVLPLVKSLEKGVGTKFWIDLEGIESTAQFEDVIVQAIMQCDILLFMLSDNSTNGKWTQREVFFAEKLGRQIVPIIIDGGEPEGWAAFHFANVNYIDAKQPYQLEGLAKDMQDWLEIMAPAADKVVKEDKRPIRHRFTSMSKKTFRILLKHLISKEVTCHEER